jgi:hypothetical protein
MEIINGLMAKPLKSHKIKQQVTRALHRHNRNTYSIISGNTEADKLNSFHFGAGVFSGLKEGGSTWTTDSDGCKV